MFFLDIMIDTFISGNLFLKIHHLPEYANNDYAHSYLCTGNLLVQFYSSGLESTSIIK